MAFDGRVPMPTDGISGRITRVAAFIAVLTTADTFAAQSRCAKLWFRVAGEGAKATAACHAKAIGGGTAVDPTCLAAAGEKLTRKWTKATREGDCPTAADAASAQERVDAFLAAIEDLLTPPTVSHCCATGSACYAGSSIDAGTCLELLGTLGPPGSVCEGSTGACVAPPGTGGSCCDLPQFSLCTAGPGVTPANCVTGGGLDVPNAVCHDVGACAVE